jgi:hypothetical protein
MTETQRMANLQIQQADKFTSSNLANLEEDVNNTRSARYPNW